jgi:hypothetical protein
MRGVIAFHILNGYTHALSGAVEWSASDRPEEPHARHHSPSAIP